MAADGIPQTVRTQAAEQGGAPYVAPDGGAYIFLSTPAGDRVFVNNCPHRRLPLDRRGRLRFSGEKRLLVCPNHGAKFEPETGRCVSGPCFGKHLQRVLDLER
jgi:nitrite reductase/ring-hydroxylating ferredoxin subunit